MGKYDGATIEVVNWNKFNPRKDLKASTWFRLQNSLFEDPNFIDFTDGEILSFLYVLALCSKKQGGTIRLNMQHAERIGRRTARDIEGALSKLEELQIVRITLKEPNADVTSTSRMRDVCVPLRDERDERDETNERSPPGVEKSEPPTRAVWIAYEEAWKGRHPGEPLRDRTVNSQLATFVRRVGREDAPAIAAFYVTHNDPFYVKNRHPVNLLLRDVERIRGDWQAGRGITHGEAKNAESLDYYKNQMARVERGEI